MNILNLFGGFYFCYYLLSMDPILGSVYLLMFLFALYVVYLSVSPDSEHRSPQQWLKDTKHDLKKKINDSLKKSNKKKR